MKLTIAVLHYNNKELTEACIESIMAQDLNDLTLPIELIVIDNGSTEPYESPGIKVIRLPRNVGNVAGQNACFDHAEGDLVLFVSNDVRLQADCIKNMLIFESEREHPWGQIQPVILNADLTEQNAGMDYHWPGYGIGRTEHTFLFTPIVPSITYLMKKSEWAHRGGFDERLPMAYEDVDFGLRGARSRIPNFVVPDASAIHLANATLRYTKKDRWRFHQARKIVVLKHFRGLDRFIRLTAINIIDCITNWAN